MDYLYYYKNMKYESLDLETLWLNDIAYALCVAITNNDKTLFKIVEKENIHNNEILNFILENCSTKKIYYVHNLTFETFVLLKKIIENKIKFKIISSNKIVYSLDLFYKNKKIRFRCSYRLTLLSLKKLSLLCKIQEKTIFPYKILNEDFKKNITINEDMFNTVSEYNKFKNQYGININTYEILEEYCKNDVIITKNAIIKYWNIIKEGGLENTGKILTAAKLSIENFFKNKTVIKKKIPLKIDRILRRNYYGGRTEVFGNPNEDEILLHYDWSGMYAQCMEEKVLGGEIIYSNIIENIKNPGFYRIKFEQHLEIPILPIKTKKLLFANGIFEGWYWFEEILLAIEYNVKIIEIYEMISCQYYGEYLKVFVKNNTEMRKISDIHKQIGKNNNNSFYGRLGMNPERLEETIISGNEDVKKYEKISEINGVWVGYKKGDKSISNLLISASITSKARIKLYRGMQEVIKNGGRICYTDTDSIIASFKKNNYKEKLDIYMGEVYFDSNKNDTIITDGVFALPKTYAIKYENNNKIVKIKGFNSTPTFEEFKNKFYNKERITTINTEWSKKDFIIKYSVREKTTDLFGLTKRIWNSTLKNTIPLHIQSSENNLTDISPIYVENLEIKYNTINIKISKEIENLNKNDLFNLYSTVQSIINLEKINGNGCKNASLQIKYINQTKNTEYINIFNLIRLLSAYEFIKYFCSFNINRNEQSMDTRLNQDYYAEDNKIQEHSIHIGMVFPIKSTKNDIYKRSNVYLKSIELLNEETDLYKIILEDIYKNKIV